MTIKHSPRIVTDGLVVHYDAANTKSYPGSGTAWKDLSGKGNNGTIYGATFGSGNYFDGDIAEVLVYDRAITAAEVLQNYQALKERYL